MMSRTLVLLVLHGLYAGWLWSLATGSPWLERELPGGLPWGNLFTTLALAALPAAAALLAPPGSRARRFALAGVVLGLAWLPVSAAMAGNLALDFREGGGTAWLVWSVGIVLAGWLAYPWSVLARWLANRRRKA